MQLQNAIQAVFAQLSDSLRQLTAEQYRAHCKNLSGHSVGEHVRHIVEMFQCLEIGYQSGELDYEKRKRDKLIETHAEVAIALLQDIVQQISKSNKQLTLLAYFDSEDQAEKISTNYLREVAYNLEHAIHHMALIRVGLVEMGNMLLADTYGVATTTSKYRKRCAQ